MRIDIEKTLREGGMLEATLAMGTLEWEEGAEIEVRPVSLKGRLTRVRRGCEFQADLLGGVTLECVRCLQSFSLDLAFAHAGESQIQGADCDLYPCKDGKVDLAVIAREQIYLHIPLKPVCLDLCQGLCLTCGEDLNRGPCRCGDPAHVRVV